MLMFLRCTLFLLLISEAFAQDVTGARYLAMGNTGTALQDVNSLTVNQAGLTGLRRITAALFYQSHYFNTDIHSQALLMAVPTRLGVFGGKADRYALSGVYTEIKTGLTYARKFGDQFSAAMAVNYHQLRIRNYGGSEAFTVEAGIQYQVLPQLMLGFHYANPGNMGYDNDTFAVLPSVMRAGAAYAFELVWVSMDVISQVDGGLDWRMGLEYKLINWLALRGGISVSPMQQYAGFGVDLENLVFDFSAMFHPQLGMSPQIGLSYGF